ncbi:MAG: hypothetical protein CMP23_10735 [Rickettsiales bacterium]|nr:hypothetical protein [Rickettsiales bacterium]
MLAALVICWILLQVLWLAQDERIVEGDVMGNVGAAELFRVDRWKMSAPEVLLRSYVEDFGEYPALFPALTGIALAAAGVTDLDGDGPALVGLGWSLMALLGTWLLGLLLGGPRLATLAAAVLALSPFWSATQRQLLLENGLCAALVWVLALVLLALRYEGRAAVRSAQLCWLLSGMSAGLALLIKQTAVLVLVPLGLAVLVLALLPGLATWRFAAGSRRRAGWDLLGGPTLAVAAALLIAAPWYLRQQGAHDGYLLRSLAANPDAVGPLHQLLYYPLVLLQLPWAPASLLLLLLGAIGMRRREAAFDLGPAPLPALGGRPGSALLWLVVVLSLVFLVLLPKKYPRLLLPLLPLLSVLMAIELQRWSAGRRSLLLLALAVSLVASSFSVGSLSNVLATSRLGLVEVDERCFQSWIEAPSRPGLPWSELLDALEDVGGRGGEYRVGALRWPVPPCSHQTTHDLGQHLRVRVRRAGLDARVLAGEDAFEIAGSWAEGLPAVLISDGPAACSDRFDCGGLPTLELARRLPSEVSGWPLDLHLYRVAGASR